MFRRLFISTALCILTFQAQAQMVLPGAVAPGVEGSVQTPAGGPQAPRALVAVKIAGEDAVIARPLHLNGTYGLIEIGKTGDHLALTKLTLAGNMISRPGDVCQIDVLAGAPAPLTAAGKPNGILRYDNKMPACSFSLDILPGAVLLKSSENVCRFVAADCNVRPDGMWGPAPSAISPDQASSDVHALTAAETAVRASFRDLMERQKDRNTIRTLAHEQAAFSSEREEMCRDYAREDQHGFCAARFTEAKLAYLHQRLGLKSETGLSVAPRKKPAVTPAPPASSARMQLN